MFTGLVQRTGVLLSLSRSGGGARLQVRAEPWPDALQHGESLAVQGACLTVAGSADGCFLADVLDETLERTTLGRLPAGSRLNLERAVRLTDRLGGHLVSGHVDTVAELLEVRPRGRDRVLRLRCEPAAFRLVVPKGSVTLDGVSLTVSALLEDASAFEVHLIPTTWAETSLSERRAGDGLNLETDLLGKYVDRLLRRAPPSSGITLESLAAAGFPVEQ